MLNQKQYLIGKHLMQRLLCSTFASAMLLTLTPAHADTQPKIINGQTASASQFPWQVGLMEGNTELYDKQFCSGTIIAAQWIVTAAHCVEQPPPKFACDRRHYRLI